MRIIRKGDSPTTEFLGEWLVIKNSAYGSFLLLLCNPPHCVGMVEYFAHGVAMLLDIKTGKQRLKKATELVGYRLIPEIPVWDLFHFFLGTLILYTNK